MQIYNTEVRYLGYSSCRAAAQGVARGRGDRAVMCHPIDPTLDYSYPTSVLPLPVAQECHFLH